MHEHQEDKDHDNRKNVNVNIKTNNEEIEVVEEFIFLGSKIDHDGVCAPDIKRRLALGRNAMVSMNNIWKSKDISLATKCRLVSVIVFPVATYSCETWMLKKADRQKIYVFELWCWRHPLCILWTARITNQAALEWIRLENLWSPR